MAKQCFIPVLKTFLLEDNQCSCCKINSSLIVSGMKLNTAIVDTIHNNLSDPSFLVTPLCFNPWYLTVGAKIKELNGVASLEYYQGVIQSPYPQT